MAYNKLLQDICTADLGKYLKINRSYSRHGRNIPMYVHVSTCMKIVLLDLEEFLFCQSMLF